MLHGSLVVTTKSNVLQ